ncbi:MAG: hypothetical protein QOF78_3696 [Phycisphaerales bacterium]|nr:hypothetical protein [Phycisphaerales bacterium]
MARRKNAAALFEVIHADNRFPKRHVSRWSLRAPRLPWFGRKSSDDASAPAAASMPAAPETIDYQPAEPRGPSFFARAMSMIPAMPRIGMSLDPERQVVRVQLSYTGAMVTAFSLVVAIALAYLVGRQTSHRPMPALAEQTTEELRNGPAYADVLNINNDNDAPPAMAVGATPTGRTATGIAAPAAARQQPASPTVASGARQSPSGATAIANAPPQAQPALHGVRPSQWEPRIPETLSVSDENRTAGMQYVIIQSYPEEERELAEAAKQMLNQHGVLCTVVRGLPYAPTWYSVVGITGFARVKDVPEYDAYVARVQQISDQFAGTSKFKKFEPKPFRWRAMKTTPEKSATTTTGAAKPATPKQ